MKLKALSISILVGMLAIITTSCSTPNPENNTSVSSPEPTKIEEDPTISSQNSELETTFVNVADDENLIKVKIPSNWKIIKRPEANSQNGFDPRIVASPDIEEFFSGYDVPGVEIRIQGQEFQPTDLGEDCNTKDGPKKSNFRWTNTTESYVINYHECGDNKNTSYVENLARIYVPPKDQSGQKGSNLFIKVAYQVTDPDQIEVFETILGSLQLP